MKWLHDARASATVAPSSSHRLFVPRCDSRSQAPAAVKRANARIVRVTIFFSAGNVCRIDPACASGSSLAVDILPGPGQHQRYIVGLFVPTDPIRYGSRYDVADARERLIAMELNQLDQAAFAEFAKLIFGLRHTVTERNENVAWPHRNARLLVAHAIKQTDYGSGCIQLRHAAIPRNHVGGEMSRVRVGQRPRCCVIAAQEHGRVLLRWRTAIELVIERGHQHSRRKTTVMIAVPAI